MKRSMLSFAVLIAGIGAIAASQQGDFSTYKILKPLTTVLIIIIALFSFNRENKIYNKYIIIALIFCLTGDIFLLKSDYFLCGLVA
ncbi:MAG: lysoplasmalogenase, partial [Saprospiraceae bacterium]|nr:lysoplasmalogenase [Saprospiraceae bacterium]